MKILLYIYPASDGTGINIRLCPLHMFAVRPRLTFEELQIIYTTSMKINPI